MDKGLKRLIKENVKGEVKFAVPMKEHTTLRIGGRADVIVCPRDIDDLQVVIGICRDHGLKPFVKGEGSNLLVGDTGIKGVVLDLREGFSNLEVIGKEVTGGAGLKLKRMIELVRDEGLSGMEFLYGIPGTIGGAIVMNAGTDEGEIEGIVKDVTILNKKGALNVRKRFEIEFGYRHMGIGEGEIILGARFTLTPDNTTSINKRMRDVIKQRRLRFRNSIPNAGSVFKNPPGNRAAILVERAGLKGFRIGGAQVSLEHANVIINRGWATQRDVSELMRLIKDRVYEKDGLMLEEEIRFIGI